MVWQECDAAERFDEFHDAALTDGPQTVTRNGVEVAVLVSVSEWTALKAKSEKFESKADSLERL